MTATAPRVLVEGGEAERGPVEGRLEAEGWRLSRGWEAPSGRFDARAGSVVCVGAVRSEGEAADVVLAAARGAGVLACVEAGSPLLGRLYDDLRRIGPTQLVAAGAEPEPRLDPEQTELLECLAAGATLADVATALGYSRRTINRRLAAARKALGVRTTAEALASYLRQKLE